MNLAMETERMSKLSGKREREDNNDRTRRGCTVHARVACAVAGARAVLDRVARRGSARVDESSDMVETARKSGGKRKAEESSEGQTAL